MKGIKFEKVSFGAFLKDALVCSVDQRVVWDTDYPSFSDYLKNIYDRIEVPTRKTKGSAGYDFNCPFEINIDPEKKVKFPTGIKAKMPEGVVLQVHIRSSLGIKHDLCITNTTGIIDSDYYNNTNNEGDIIISLTNNGANNYVTESHKAVAQGIFTKYETTEDDKTDGERIGGIGSTSK